MKVSLALGPSYPLPRSTQIERAHIISNMVLTSDNGYKVAQFPFDEESMEDGRYRNISKIEISDNDPKIPGEFSHHVGVR